MSLKRAFEPTKLGALVLPNRFIKAATFEGKTPDGLPGEAYLDFHKQIAEGGVGLTTLAYCATEADGRIDDQMMYMHQDLVPTLAPIISQLKRSGARVSGQLVHCGNFSRNKSLVRLKRPQGPSWRINHAGLMEGLPFSDAMNSTDMDYFVNTYAIAARLMKQMGFDAIELHFGHGYGLSQFISPKTNRRTDEYGGSLLNRMRLPLRVLETVRGEVGDDFPLLGKISLTDGVHGGLEESEAIEVASLLDQAGIDALIPSSGTSSFNVMKMFHGDSFLEGLIELEKNPVTRLGMKLVGKSMFKHYPYEELYLLEGARRVRDKVNCAVAYIGGCSTPQGVETLMEEGFDFIQLGRVLIKDSNFINSLKQNPTHQSGCIHCNKCVPLINHPDGVRCLLND